MRNDDDDFDEGPFKFELTDEEKAELERLWKIYDAPPPKDMATIGYDPEKLAKWLIDKYTAWYRMILVHMKADPEKSKDWRLTGTDTECMEFCASLGLQAQRFFVRRLNQLVQIALQKAVVETDAMLAYFIFSLWEDDDEAKRFLPTKTRIARLSKLIEKNYADLSWARETRGGDRRSAAELSETARQAVAKRKAELKPFWAELIKQFEAFWYGDDVWGWIKTHEQFKKQCAKYNITSIDILDELAPKVVERRPYWEKETTDTMPEPLYPSSFALIHAAREMGVSGDYWALKRSVDSAGKAKRATRKPRAREIKK